jgi:hypothetical protein
MIANLYDDRNGGQSIHQRAPVSRDTSGKQRRSGEGRAEKLAGAIARAIAKR